MLLFPSQTGHMLTSFGVSLFYLKYILCNPLKWPILFPKSWASTSYFSNSAGSSVTSGRFSPCIVAIDKMSLLTLLQNAWWLEDFSTWGLASNKWSPDFARIREEGGGAIRFTSKEAIYLHLVVEHLVVTVLEASSVVLHLSVSPLAMLH
jgi:hypothetical protein